MTNYRDCELLTFDQDGPVLTVRFNNPDDYNAITRPMHAELVRTFAAIRTDPEVRAVVLTGTGTAFSAGGNLKGKRMSVGTELDTFFREARRIVIELLELPQPIVAAINGPAGGASARPSRCCATSATCPGPRSWPTRTSRSASWRATAGWWPGRGWSACPGPRSSCSPATS